MRSKQAILMIVGMAGFCFANVTFAAAFMPPPKCPPPKKAKKVCPKARPIIYENSYPHFVYQHPYFYFGAGVGAYHLNNPTVSVGNFFNTTAPIASIDNDGVTPIYNFNFGYTFYNPRNSIFGHFNDITFKFDYFSTTSSKRNNLTGTGDIWYIDGSGRLGGGSQTLSNYSLSAKHRLIDTGFYYRSIPSRAAISGFTMHPRVGLIWTNFNAKYDYSVYYGSTDKEEYKIKTNYFGVAAGDRLAFHLAPQILLSGDIELQLLHAMSDLDAHQQADVANPLTIRDVSSSSSKSVTYRAIASLGAKYTFTVRANGISVGAKVGLDRWGYNPKVVTPNSGNGGSRIHLDGTSQNNFFATLNVTVPLG